MKILHLYKDYYPVLGGVENYIKMVAEAQAQAGHQVTVLVCSPTLQTKTEWLNEVKVIKAGRLFTAASMPISLAQPLHLLLQQADIVHIHSPYPLGELVNWLLGRGKATVITHHSDIVRESQQKWLAFYGPFLKRILGAAARIITTSPRYTATSPWLNPVANKCTPIPIGIDIDHFSPSSRKPNPEAAYQLLFVGRLRYYKGLETLIQAMQFLPDTHLTIGGTGPMEAEWQSLAESLGLLDRITFSGEIPDNKLVETYHQADCFVLPANARSEAYGIVLVEAMATGLPCITTEIGTGTSWLVQDGETGYVVPPLNVEALVQTINTLRLDRALSQKMGEAGRKRAEQALSQTQMCRQIMQVYQEALSS